ncbi:MAG: hypothetical protein A2293_15655 [Elusimicrobia bacterium RIFOXYB2_FULL_49_7]|nr:MAG: hypothetical protein A2293_15655 [Elusimicrobia bacterium RIFOXYB2_FULL_49_7]
MLIQPPVEDFYSTPSRTYPLGLLYLAAGPLKAGHDVRILDAMAFGKSRVIPLPAHLKYLEPYYIPGDKSPYRLFSHFRHFGLSYDEIEASVRAFSPDVIGISSLFSAYHSSAIETAKRARRAAPLARLVMGGGHITATREKPEGVDAIICGEGEEPWMAYLGLSLSPGPLLPARELINPLHYQIQGRPGAFLLTSRGCPYGCEFCSVALTFPKHTVREPREVLQEIRDGYDRFGIRHFDIEDDNFGLARESALAVLKGVVALKRPITLSAMNGLSAEVLDTELLEWMRRAGFGWLDLSAVSVHPASLRHLNRPFGPAAFTETVRRATALGFPVTAYFILGLPEETLEEMVDTLAFLFSLPVKIAPSLFYPVPGTLSYDTCAQKGLLPVKHYDLCRLTAAAVETDHFNRLDLFTLFRYCRLLNLFKEEVNGKENAAALSDFRETEKLYHYLKKGRYEVMVSERVMGLLRERFSALLM